TGRHRPERTADQQHDESGEKKNDHCAKANRRPEPAAITAREVWQHGILLRIPPYIGSIAVEDHLTPSTAPAAASGSAGAAFAHGRYCYGVVRYGAKSSQIRWIIRGSTARASAFSGCFCEYSTTFRPAHDGASASWSNTYSPSLIVSLSEIRVSI